MHNYPDGMSEGDLPGYWDIECPNCDDTDPDEDCGLCDGTGIVDSREMSRRTRDNARADLDEYEARHG